MIHRITSAVLAVVLAGCAAPLLPAIMPMPVGMAQATAAPGRAGCALLGGYGGGGLQAGAPVGGFGYAMSAGMRALQNFGGCPPAGTAPPSDAARGPAEDMTAQVKILVSQKNVCTEAVRARPEFAPVAAHFSAVETGQFSMVQLADTAHPSAAEARLVARYYDASSPCIRALQASFTKLSPSDGAVLDQSIAAQQTVVTQLATRRISWGEFAQASQKISAQAAAKFQTAGL